MVVRDAQSGAARRVLLCGAERLQEGFLRMQRDRSATASGGRAVRRGADTADTSSRESARWWPRAEWATVCAAGHVTCAGREIDREGLFRKAVAVPTGPRFRANGDARRVELRNQRAREIAPIDKQLVERPVRRDRGQHLRERGVLGLVGRPDDGVDDHVRRRPA